MIGPLKLKRSERGINNIPQWLHSVLLLLGERIGGCNLQQNFLRVLCSRAFKGSGSGSISSSSSTSTSCMESDGSGGVGLSCSNKGVDNMCTSG